MTRSPSRRGNSLRTSYGDMKVTLYLGNTYEWKVEMVFRWRDGGRGTELIPITMKSQSFVKADFGFVWASVSVTMLLVAWNRIPRPNWHFSGFTHHQWGLICLPFFQLRPPPRVRISLCQSGIPSQIMSRWHQRCI